MRRQRIHHPLPSSHNRLKNNPAADQLDHAASNDPIHHTLASPVLHAQQTHGNRAVRRHLQNTIQRHWQDQALDYRVISKEKTDKQISTSSAKKKVFGGVEDFVAKFHEGVLKGDQKKATSALASLKSTLQSDKARIEKKFADSYYEMFRIEARTFFDKWIGITSEHIKHLTEQPSAMRDFYEFYIGPIDYKLPAHIDAAYKAYQRHDGNPEQKYASLINVKTLCLEYLKFNAPTNIAYGTVRGFLDEVNQELAKMAHRPANDASAQEEYMNVRSDESAGRKMRFGKKAIPAEVNCALATTVGILRHITGKPVTTGELVGAIEAKRGAAPDASFTSIYQHPEIFTQSLYKNLGSITEVSKVNDNAGKGITDIIEGSGVKKVGEGHSLDFPEARQRMEAIVKANPNAVFAFLYDGHWNMAFGGGGGNVIFMDYQADHINYEGAFASDRPYLGIRQTKLSEAKATMKASFIAFV